MKIYGSTALKHWYPDFNRIPSDLDIISKEKDWIEAFNYLIENNEEEYIKPDFLYDIKWEKTMWDIQFLKEKGCKLDKHFYDLLIKDWAIIHKQKRINLNVKNEEFFNSNIKRKYDHDYLHEVFAFYNKPLNYRIRKDLTKPLCNEELFNNLSYDDKLKLALEEIYVIATERFILNQGFSNRRSKLLAIKLIITSLSKGFFNLFIIENFLTLLKYEDTQWQQKLQLLI
jgi:hypothetical protein